MKTQASEILISAKQVTRQDLGDAYEFILNEQLQVIECVKIISLPQRIIRPIDDISKALEGMLFELGHVRVNPRLDNTQIIHILTQALNEIGVEVFNPPANETMAICYKPLGEISDNVRFYLNRQGNLIFLSPALRLRLIENHGDSKAKLKR